MSCRCGHRWHRNVAVCAHCDHPIERVGFDLILAGALITGKVAWDHVVVRPGELYDHEAEPFTVRHLALLEAAWPTDE